MMFQRIQTIISLFVLALFITSSAFALELPLSSEGVREAYFLGQRRDDTTSKFLDSYRQHLPAPKSGTYVSMVELLTPYAEAVELSRQRSVGYSAQQAEQEYRHRGNSVRLGVYLRYGATCGFDRPNGSWRDYQVRFSQDGKVRDPLSVRYEGTRIGTGAGRSGGGACPTGFVIWLEYDAEKLSSSEALVETDMPDGQHAVATFDLQKLR